MKHNGLDFSDLRDEFLTDLFRGWENEKAPDHLKRNIMSEVLLHWSHHPAERKPFKLAPEYWLMLVLCGLAVVFLIVFVDFSNALDQVNQNHFNMNINWFKQVESFLEQITSAVLNIPSVFYFLMFGLTVIWLFDRLLMRLRRL